MFFILFAFIESKAQMVVFDGALNRKLATQTKNNSLTLGYEQLKTEIANGSLTKAKQIADQVTKQFAVMSDVYAVANGVQSLKKVRNFYNKAALINQTINIMVRYLSTTPKSAIPHDSKRVITKGISTSISDMGLALETIEYGMNPINKLSLRDRLAQIDEAMVRLDAASSKLSQGYSMIQSASQIKEMKDKHEHYNRLKYGF